MSPGPVALASARGQAASTRAGPTATGAPLPGRSAMFEKTFIPTLAPAAPPLAAPTTPPAVPATPPAAPAAAPSPPQQSTTPARVGEGRAPEGGTASAIQPSDDPNALAQALAADPAIIRAASFVTRPPLGFPTATSTTSLAGFPRAGQSYAILTSGDGPFAVTATVSNGTDDPVSATTTVQVTNVAPTVVIDQPKPATTIELGQALTLSALFRDPATNDTHTCSVDWSDGTVSVGSVTERLGGGTCTARHTYTTPGPFTITVDVLDDDTGAAGGVSLAPDPSTRATQPITVPAPSAAGTSPSTTVTTTAAAAVPTTVASRTLRRPPRAS